MAPSRSPQEPRTGHSKGVVAWTPVSASQEGTLR